MTEIIRIAKLADIDRIAGVLVFAKRVAYRPIFQDDAYLFHTLLVKTITTHIKETYDLSRLLIYDDGIIKGMLYYEIDKKQHSCASKELYVDPFFQHQHIGSALWEYVNQQNTYQHYQLWVIEEHHQARGFYETKGCRASKERQLVEGTSHYEIKYIK